VTWRVLVCLFGSLVLAVGAGLTWALLFPSTRTNNIFFGGMLMPLVWVAAMLWLWFSSWRQLWLRLLPTAALLYSAMFLGYRYG
jgi:Na+/melibiose symporter-like transporter